MKALLTFIFLISMVAITKARVELPSLFANHMVIQRDQPIMVWGTAAAGEKITLQFNKQIKSIAANLSGTWKIHETPG